MGIAIGRGIDQAQQALGAPEPIALIVAILSAQIHGRL